MWVLICFACNAKTGSESSADSSKKRNSDAVVAPPTYKSYPGDESEDDGESTGIQDGSYSATVDYDNPNTGYSATYTLSVEVSDGQVVQINFPNDGYLDEDHITAADIDDDGNALVEGEDGKTYNVHIDI